MKVLNFQATVGRLENQLKQEKIENKNYQHQIKKLYGDLLIMDSEPARGQSTKKILAEKKKTQFNYWKIN